jgi:hypothetical protein
MKQTLALLAALSLGAALSVLAQDVQNPPAPVKSGVVKKAPEGQVAPPAQGATQNQFDETKPSSNQGTTSQSATSPASPGAAVTGQGQTMKPEQSQTETAKKKVEQ